MADNDDLMIEVTGSSNKAAAALDKIIEKVSQLQKAIEQATPSLSKFTEKLDSITAGSKAFAMLAKLSNGTNDVALASKKAEAAEAMYQARIERSIVSMERSRIASEKLAAARRKMQEYAAIDAHNQAAFSMSPEEFKRKFDHTATETPTETVAPEAPEVNAPTAPSMKYDAASIQAQIDALAAKIGEKTPKINIDAEAATAEVRKIGEYIDSLKPKVSSMSAEAQEKFNALAAKLTLISQKIDNQRLVIRGYLADSAKIASEYGEGSMKYILLEKRILGAKSALDSLMAKQDKLKAQLAEIGDVSEKAANKSFRNWNRFWRMMGSMLVRIAAFRLYSAASQAITEGIQNMALAGGQANQTMSALATSSLYLKNSIAAALMPALQALTPVIVRVADAISWVANKVAIFIAQVTGQKTVTIATKSYVDYAKSLNKTGDNASKANKKVKELQRTIMSFDELHVLNKNVNDALASSPKSNTPDYGSMFKTIPTPPSNFSNLFKDVPKVFDKLKDAADKGGKALDEVKEKAKELEEELNKVKLPALGSWKVPAFPKVTVPALDLDAWNKSKNKYQQPVRAPALTPATAPAIILKGFLDSRAKYQKPIAPPIFLPVIAPAIILKRFLESKAIYQAPITPPSVKPAVAPALVLNTLFTPSIQAAEQKIRNFSTSTQATVRVWGTNVSNNFGKTWNAVSTSTGVVLSGIKGKISRHGRDTSSAFARVGNNIMRNARLTFSFIPIAVAGGLNAAGKDISRWLSSASKGFANFGRNIVHNIGKTMQAWYSNFVSGLSAAWRQFTSFMGAIGEKISGWWSANKSWAAPAIIGGLVALNVGIAIATAGASIPAQAALAGVTGLATGGLVTGPTYSLIGEGEDNEAVLPLNQNVFSQIAQGIVRNGGNSSFDADIRNQISEISKQIAALKEAILSRPVKLYTDDRIIAESAERGRTQLARQYHIAE